MAPAHTNPTHIHQPAAPTLTRSASKARWTPCVSHINPQRMQGGTETPGRPTITRSASKAGR